jgi:hypothetical protein
MGKETMNKIFAYIVGAFLLIITFSPFASSIFPDVNNSKATTTATQSSTKWAVLIAASGGFTYWLHEILERHDIRDLKQVLLTHGWERDHIRCFLEEDATTDAILNT